MNEQALQHFNSSPGAFDIPGFCFAYKISRSQAYKEIAAQRLRIFKVGKRTLISHDAARAWQSLFEPKG